MIDATHEVNKRPLVTMPTNNFFGVAPKIAANRDPTNGAKSAIYTYFSITPNLSFFEVYQDRYYPLFYTKVQVTQVQLLLHLQQRQ